MGLVGSALTTGRNALLAYQGALQVVGANVANAGNADYARQSADLTPVTGISVGPGLQPGAGVTLSALRRHVDESLENRLRTATGERQSALNEQQGLDQIGVFFDDISSAGISQRITDFFNAMSDVQNAPDDLAVRAVAVTSAEELAGALRTTRQDLIEVGQEINKDIDQYATEGDRIASEIAELNTEIASVEAGGTGKANALRDRRDGLLRQLSQIFDVSTREQPDGSLIVYIGSEPLVQHGVSRGVTTTQSLDGEFARTVVRFADNNGRVKVAGGAIEGLITARDNHAFARVQLIDDLAGAVIKEVNAAHADGQGLTQFRNVTSASVVADPTAALNSSDAALDITPQNGSFYITVADDATSTPVSARIEVDLDGQGADTTLEDIVTQINDNLEGITASVTADNRLSIVADTGFSFSFGHDGEDFRKDTSGLLASLGINTFFQGSSAADMAVRPELLQDPGRLAAATVNRVGDGNNAARIAGVIDAPSDSLNGTSIIGFFNTIANGVAGDGAAARNKAEASDAVVSALSAQREAVSGVSLDEEAIDLLKFERAFQGAARYVSVVDRLMQELMLLVQ